MHGELWNQVFGECPKLPEKSAITGCAYRGKKFRFTSGVFNHLPGRHSPEIQHDPIEKAVRAYAKDKTKLEHAC